MSGGTSVNHGTGEPEDPQKTLPADEAPTASPISSTLYRECTRSGIRHLRKSNTSSRAGGASGTSSACSFCSSACPPSSISACLSSNFADGLTQAWRSAVNHCKVTRSRPAGTSSIRRSKSRQSRRCRSWSFSGPICRRSADSRGVPASGSEDATAPSSSRRRRAAWRRGTAARSPGRARG